MSEGNSDPWLKWRASKWSAEGKGEVVVFVLV